MTGHAFPGVISRQAAVVAPALMTMAIILFMGKVSGAHLNRAVSIAFALRRDFPSWRVPGYIVLQLIGLRTPPSSCTPSSMFQASTVPTPATGPNLTAMAWLKHPESVHVAECPNAWLCNSAAPSTILSTTAMFVRMPPPKVIQRPYFSQRGLMRLSRTFDCWNNSCQGATVVPIMATMSRMAELLTPRRYRG